MAYHSLHLHANLTRPFPACGPAAHPHDFTDGLWPPPLNNPLQRRSATGRHPNAIFITAFGDLLLADILMPFSSPHTLAKGSRRSL
ncbi:hypothetical protein TREES_T100015158 [Tupaia chinensis]|uniref:Uncharacterized protein n=1 Tax=Tupaia chinensis TaxID=246437 RepID=L9JGC8_TUPCH|nr:hypothetical protein TREES_T100015158 [Tupaia chinensis]